MQHLFSILLAAFAMLCFSACEETPQWKLPTSVALNIQLEAPTGGPGTFIFTDGAIQVSTITISGSLEDGDDFQFSRSFPQGLVVDFAASNIMDELKFDLPQGNYSELKIHLETMLSNQSILAKGIFDYNNPNKPDAAITFQVDSICVFDLFVTDSQGKASFGISDKNNHHINIALNPPYWFKNITSTMMNNSSSTIVNNQTHIFINKLNNPTIYHLAKARIGEDEQSTLN